MHTVNEQFTVFHRAVRILQIQRACANGLNLGARKFDSGFIPILHKVVVEGLAVLRCDFNTLFLRGDHLVFFYR